MSDLIVRCAAAMFGYATVISGELAHCALCVALFPCDHLWPVAYLFRGYLEKSTAQCLMRIHWQKILGVYVSMPPTTQQPLPGTR